MCFPLTSLANCFHMPLFFMLPDKHAFIIIFLTVIKDRVRERRSVLPGIQTLSSRHRAESHRNKNSFRIGTIPHESRRDSTCTDQSSSPSGSSGNVSMEVDNYGNSNFEMDTFPSVGPANPVHTTFLGMNQRQPELIQVEAEIHESNASSLQPEMGSMNAPVGGGVVLSGHQRNSWPRGGTQLKYRATQVEICRVAPSGDAVSRSSVSIPEELFIRPAPCKSKTNKNKLQVFQISTTQQ